MDFLPLESAFFEIANLTASWLYMPLFVLPTLVSNALSLSAVLVISNIALFFALLPLVHAFDRGRISRAAMEALPRPAAHADSAFLKAEECQTGFDAKTVFSGHSQWHHLSRGHSLTVSG